MWGSAKSRTVKTIAVFLCLLLVWQGIVWAHPELFRKSDVPPKGFYFDPPDEEKSFESAFAGYMSDFLARVELDPENRNLSEIQESVRREIDRIRDSSELPEELKDNMPSDNGSPGSGEIMIDFGTYVIRYYNHRYPGIREPGAGFRAVEDKRIGEYLSRQVLMRVTPEDGFIAKGDADELYRAFLEQKIAPRKLRPSIKKKLPKIRKRLLKRIKRSGRIDEATAKRIGDALTALAGSGAPAFVEFLPLVLLEKKEKTKARAWLLGFNTLGAPGENEGETIGRLNGLLEENFPDTVGLTSRVLDLAGDDELILEEYLLHELICPIFGHEKAREIQEKLFPENYEDILGDKVEGHQDGELGLVLKQVVWEKCQVFPQEDTSPELIKEEFRDFKKQIFTGEGPQKATSFYSHYKKYREWVKRIAMLRQSRRRQDRGSREEAHMWIRRIDKQYQLIFARLQLIWEMESIWSRGVLQDGKVSAAEITKDRSPGELNEHELRAVQQAVRELIGKYEIFLMTSPVGEDLKEDIYIKAALEELSDRYLGSRDIPVKDGSADGSAGAVTPASSFGEITEDTDRDLEERKKERGIKPAGKKSRKDAKGRVPGVRGRINWGDLIVTYIAALGLAAIFWAVLPVHPVTVTIAIVLPLAVFIYMLCRHWSWWNFFAAVGVSLILSTLLPVPWFGLSLAVMVLVRMGASPKPTAAGARKELERRYAEREKKKAERAGAGEGDTKGSGKDASPEKPAGKSQIARTRADYPLPGEGKEGKKESREEKGDGAPEDGKEGDTAEEVISFPEIKISDDLKGPMIEVISFIIERTRKHRKDKGEEDEDGEDALPTLTIDSLLDIIFRLDLEEDIEVNKKVKAELRDRVMREIDKIENGFSFDLKNALIRLKKWRTVDEELLAEAFQEIAQEVAHEVGLSNNPEESREQMLAIQELIGEYFGIEKWKFRRIRTLLVLHIIREQIENDEMFGRAKAEDYYLLGRLEFHCGDYDTAEKSFGIAAAMESGKALSGDMSRYGDYLFSFSLVRHYLRKWDDARVGYRLSMNSREMRVSSLKEKERREGLTDEEKDELKLHALKMELTKLLQEKAESHETIAGEKESGPGEAPSLILLIKDLFGRKEALTDAYAVHTAPWLEELIFTAAPLTVLIPLTAFGIIGAAWFFGVMGLSCTISLLLHSRNKDLVPSYVTGRWAKLRYIFSAPIKVMSVNLGISLMAFSAALKLDFPVSGVLAVSIALVFLAYSFAHSFHRAVNVRAVNYRKEAPAAIGGGGRKFQRIKDDDVGRLRHQFVVLGIDTRPLSSGADLIREIAKKAIELKVSNLRRDDIWYWSPAELIDVLILPPGRTQKGEGPADRLRSMRIVREMLFSNGLEEVCAALGIGKAGVLDKPLISGEERTRRREEEKKEREARQGRVKKLQEEGERKEKAVLIRQEIEKNIRRMLVLGDLAAREVIDNLTEDEKRFMVAVVNYARAKKTGGSPLGRGYREMMMDALTLEAPVTSPRESIQGRREIDAFLEERLYFGADIFLEYHVLLENIGARGVSREAFLRTMAEKFNEAVQGSSRGAGFAGCMAGRKYVIRSTSPESVAGNELIEGPRAVALSLSGHTMSKMLEGAAADLKKRRRGGSSPAMMRWLKKLIAPKMDDEEYSVSAAPGVEEALFWTVPYAVVSYIAGPAGWAAVAVMTAVRLVMFLGHEGARPHAPPRRWIIPLLVSLAGILLVAIPTAAGCTTAAPLDMIAGSTLIILLVHFISNIVALLTGLDPANLAGGYMKYGIPAPDDRFNGLFGSVEPDTRMVFHMALRNFLNIPRGRAGVYEASYSDISSILLSTDLDEVIMVDSIPFRDPGVQYQEWEVLKRVFLMNKGIFPDFNTKILEQIDLHRELEHPILWELEKIGASNVKVQEKVFRGKRVFDIRFDWAYEGGTERPRRIVCFPGTDLLKDTPDRQALYAYYEKRKKDIALFYYKKSEVLGGPDMRSEAHLKRVASIADPGTLFVTDFDISAQIPYRFSRKRPDGGLGSFLADHPDFRFGKLLASTAGFYVHEVTPPGTAPLKKPAGRRKFFFEDTPPAPEAGAPVTRKKTDTRVMRFDAKKPDADSGPPVKAPGRNITRGFEFSELPPVPDSELPKVELWETPSETILNMAPALYYDAETRSIKEDVVSAAIRDTVTVPGSLGIPKEKLFRIQRMFYQAAVLRLKAIMKAGRKKDTTRIILTAGTEREAKALKEAQPLMERADEVQAGARRELEKMQLITNEGIVMGDLIELVHRVRADFDVQKTMAMDAEMEFPVLLDEDGRIVKEGPDAVQAPLIYRPMQDEFRLPEGKAHVNFARAVNLYNRGVRGDRNVVARNLKKLVQRVKETVDVEVTMASDAVLALEFMVDGRGELAGEGETPDRAAGETVFLYPMDDKLELSPGRHHVHVEEAVKRYNAERNSRIGKLAYVRAVSRDDEGVTAHVSSRVDGAETDIPLESRGKLDLEDITIRLGLMSRISDKDRALMMSVLKLLESSPPDLYVYDTLVEDLFGFASPDNGLIALHKDLAGDPVALFHEVCEYLVSLDPSIGERIEKYLDRTGRAHLAAHEEKYRAAGMEEYFRTERAHYVIRAFTRQVFGERDRWVTSLIKVSQRTEAEIEDLPDEALEHFPLEWLKAFMKMDSRREPEHKVWPAFAQRLKGLFDGIYGERTADFLTFLDRVDIRSYLEQAAAGERSDRETSFFQMESFIYTVTAPGAAGYCATLIDNMEYLEGLGILERGDHPLLFGSAAGAFLKTFKDTAHVRKYRVVRDLLDKGYLTREEFIARASGDIYGVGALESLGSEAFEPRTGEAFIGLSEEAEAFFERLGGREAFIAAWSEGSSAFYRAVKGGSLQIDLYDFPHFEKEDIFEKANKALPILEKIVGRDTAVRMWTQDPEQFVNVLAFVIEKFSGKGDVRAAFNEYFAPITARTGAEPVKFLEDNWRDIIAHNAGGFRIPVGLEIEALQSETGKYGIAFPRMPRDATYLDFFDHEMRPGNEDVRRALAFLLMMGLYVKDETSASLHPNDPNVRMIEIIPPLFRHYSAAGRLFGRLRGIGLLSAATPMDINMVLPDDFDIAILRKLQFVKHLLYTPVARLEMFGDILNDRDRVSIRTKKDFSSIRGKGVPEGGMRFEDRMNAVNAESVRFNQVMWEAYTRRSEDPRIDRRLDAYESDIREWYGSLAASSPRLRTKIRTDNVPDADIGFPQRKDNFLALRRMIGPKQNGALRSIVERALTDLEDIIGAPDPEKTADIPYSPAEIDLPRLKEEVSGILPDVTVREEKFTPLSHIKLAFRQMKEAWRGRQLTYILIYTMNILLLMRTPDTEQVVDAEGRLTGAVIRRGGWSFAAPLALAGILAMAALTAGGISVWPGIYLLLLLPSITFLTDMLLERVLGNGAALRHEWLHAYQFKLIEKARREGEINDAGAFIRDNFLELEFISRYDHAPLERADLRDIEKRTGRLIDEWKKRPATGNRLPRKEEIASYKWYISISAITVMLAGTLYYLAGDMRYLAYLGGKNKLSGGDHLSAAVFFVAAVLFAGFGIWTYFFHHPWKDKKGPGPRIPDRLTHSGPYRIFRHPMYFSMIASAFCVSMVAQIGAGWVLGMPMFLGTALIIVLLNSLARSEEKGLLEKFGDGYRTVMKRTNRWLPALSRERGKEEEPEERDPASARSRFLYETREEPYFTPEAVEIVEKEIAGLLPKGARILDLMTGANTYVPDDADPAYIVGIGLNKSEMQENPRLHGIVKQDLNAVPGLDFPDASFDAVLISNGMAYLEDPEAVLAQAARVLRPGGLIFITFTNDYFTEEATEGWKELEKDAVAELEAVIRGRDMDDRTYHKEAAARIARRRMDRVKKALFASGAFKGAHRAGPETYLQRVFKNAPWEQPIVMLTARKADSGIKAVIEDAFPGDEASLEELVSYIFEHGSQSYKDKLARLIEAKRSGDGGDVFLRVCRVGGEVAGYIYAQKTRRNGKECIYIVQMAVKPEFRGRNIAWALFNDVYEASLGEGYANFKIQATHEAIERIIRAYGFKFNSQGNMHYLGDPRAIFGEEERLETLEERKRDIEGRIRYALAELGYAPEETRDIPYEVVQLADTVVRDLNGLPEAIRNGDHSAARKLLGYLITIVNHRSKDHVGGKEPHPVMRYLVGALGQEDIFDLLDREERVPEKTRGNARTQLLTCASVAALGYVLLRALGVENVKGALSPEHAFLAIGAGEDDHIFVDITTTDVRTVGLNKLYKENESGAYLRFNRERNMQPGSRMVFEERYSRVQLTGPRGITASLRKNRGDAYAALGRYNEAAAEYGEGLLLNCDDADIHSNLGSVLHDTGRYPEAISEYTEALRLDPDLGQAWYNRGNTYRETAEYDKARADYERAAQLMPEDTDVRKALEDMESGAVMSVDRLEAEFREVWGPLAASGDRRTVGVMGREFIVEETLRYVRVGELFYIDPEHYDDLPENVKRSGEKRIIVLKLREPLVRRTRSLVYGIVSMVPILIMQADPGLVRDKVVADLGCGDGVLCLTAVKLGAKEAVGIEIGPKEAEGARANVGSNGAGNVRILNMDMKDAAPDIIKGVDTVFANLPGSVAFGRTPEGEPRNLHGDMMHLFRASSAYVACGLTDMTRDQGGARRMLEYLDEGDIKYSEAGVKLNEHVFSQFIVDPRQGIPRPAGSVIPEMRRRIAGNEPVNILFSCALNAQRSFLMDIISKQAIKEHPVFGNVRIDSCGSHAVQNSYKPLADVAVEKGVDEDIVLGFNPTPVNAEMLEKADYVIVSDPAVRDAVKEGFPDHLGKIILASDIFPELNRRLQRDIPEQHMGRYLPDYEAVSDVMSPAEFFDVFRKEVRRTLFGLDEGAGADYVVEDARPGDVEAIMEISKVLYQGGDLDREYITRAIESREKKDGYRKYLKVCRRGGEVVGFTFAGNVTRNDARRLLVTHLAVSSEHRRKGIASALVRAVVAEAREDGYSEFMMQAMHIATAMIAASQGLNYDREEEAYLLRDDAPQDYDSRPAALTGIPDRRYIERNAARSVIPMLVQALIDASRAGDKKEKIVLALDTGLGSGEINRLMRDIIRMFPTLEDNNEDLKLFFDKLEIIKGKGDTLATRLRNITGEKGRVKPENVIVVTKNANLKYYHALEGNATITGIEDSFFPETAYLPLLEVMLFTVLRHLGKSREELAGYYGMIPNVVDLDELSSRDYEDLLTAGKKTIVIRLIPDAVKFDKDVLRQMMENIRIMLARA